MALSSKVGSFAKNTATGNQAITGLGFTPKVVYFFYNERTSDGTSNDDVMGFGVMVSATIHDSISGVGQSDNRYKRQAAKAITFYNGSGNPLFEADYVSMDSDGFTINWSTADNAGEIINYLALGGNDLTNIGIIKSTDSGVTGSQSFTGMGFKPDFALFYNNHEGDGNSGTNYYYWEYGAADGTNEWAISSFSGHAAYANGDSAASTSSYFLKQADIISGQNSFTLATLTSFDTDGLTLNYTAAAAEPMDVVGMKGGRYKVGVFNQPTSTGNQAITGIGFKPKAIILMSVDRVTSTNDTTPYLHSTGATDGTNRWHLWTSNDQTNSKQNLDRTKVIKMMTSGATPTVAAEADIVSMDSDGFTINWDATDATTRQISYIAFGSKNYTLTLAETITDTDTLIKLPGRSLSETIADTASMIRTASRSLSETITDTDTFTKLRTAFSTMTEVITHIDTLLKLPGKNLTETVTDTDTFSRVWTLGRVYSEAITHTDTLIRTTTKVLTEAISHIDSFIRTVSRSLSEAITDSDVFASSRIRVSNLTETITHTDTFANLKVFVRTLSETVSTSDLLFWKYVRAAISFVKHIVTTASFTKHSSTNPSATKHSSQTASFTKETHTNPTFTKKRMN